MIDEDDDSLYLLNAIFELQEIENKRKNHQKLLQALREREETLYGGRYNYEFWRITQLYFEMEMLERHIHLLIVGKHLESILKILPKEIIQKLVTKLPLLKNTPYRTNRL